jgi:AcrR family transcriptional regulator
MTNKKVDLRIVKSKRAIRYAFLELIREKGYATITITDIANKAMINRKTFYMHYESKEALHNELINEVLDILAPTLEGIKYLSGAQQRVYLRGLLQRLMDNKDAFETMYNDSTSDVFVTQLKQRIRRDLMVNSQIEAKTLGTSFTPDLLTEAYFSIFMVFVHWWLNTDNISANELLDMIINFFSKKTLEMVGISI